MIDKGQRFTPIPRPEGQNQWPVNGAFKLNVPQSADSPQSPTPDVVLPLSLEVEVGLLQRLPETLQRIISQDFQLSSVDLRLADQAYRDKLIDAVLSFIEEKKQETTQISDASGDSNSYLSEITLLGRMDREKLVAAITKILPDLIESGDLGLPITDIQSWWYSITSYIEDVMMKYQSELQAKELPEAIVQRCMAEIAEGQTGGWMDEYIKKLLAGDNPNEEQITALRQSRDRRHLVLSEFYADYREFLTDTLTERLREEWSHRVWTAHANELARNFLTKYTPFLILDPPIAESLIPKDQQVALLKAVAELSTNPRLEGEVLICLDAQTNYTMQFIKEALNNLLQNWSGGNVPDWPKDLPS